MKVPGVKYKIEWAVKRKKLKDVNVVRVHGTDFDECLRTVLYNTDLIKEVLSRIDKHNPGHIEFKFQDLEGPPIVFDSDNFQNLIDQWMDAMTEEGVENYEMAALLRDFKI